jgi:hypothetical protein
LLAVLFFIFFVLCSFSLFVFVCFGWCCVLSSLSCYFLFYSLCCVAVLLVFGGGWGEVLSLVFGGGWVEVLGVVRWGVVGVLFGFGGGVVPTTFSVAHGGDGVKMWRWLGVWCCVWGVGVWQSW